MYWKGRFNSEHPPELRKFFDMSIKALADDITKWPEFKK